MPPRGTAVLRRLNDRGGRGSNGYFAFDGQTRVECSQGLASQADEERQPWRNQNSGKRLKKSLAPRSSANPASVRRFWTRYVRAAATCAPRLNRCCRRMRRLVVCRMELSPL